MAHSPRPLNSKKYIYLFCLSAGLVPITVGARTIDPVTGETGPVIGAQTDPWTNIVIPIVQSLGALPRGTADPDLVIRAPTNQNFFQI